MIKGETTYFATLPYLSKICRIEEEEEESGEGGREGEVEVRESGSLIVSDLMKVVVGQLVGKITGVDGALTRC